MTTMCSHVHSGNQSKKKVGKFLKQRENTLNTRREQFETADRTQHSRRQLYTDHKKEQIYKLITGKQ